MSFKNTNMSRRGFVSGSVATMVGLGLAGCSQGGSNASESGSDSNSSSSASKAHIRYDAKVNDHFFHNIALSKGYYDDANIEVEFVSCDDNVACFTSLTSGKIDLIPASGTNLPLQYIGSGEDITIYGGYMLQGCMPIIAKQGTKWNGVEDLLGKTFACSGNEFAVLGPLYDEGHDPKTEINLMVLNNHADRIEAVQKGEADYALLGTSQNFAVSQKPDIEVMCYQSDITPKYSCCRVESMTPWLQENRAAIVAMETAWLRAYQYYTENKEECKEIVAEAAGLKMDYLNAFADNEHFMINPDPCRKAVYRAWNWMGNLGFLEDGWDSMNLDDHLDTTIYKEALDACTEKYGNDNKDFYDTVNAFYNEQNA